MTVTVRDLIGMRDRSRRSRMLARLMICGVLAASASVFLSSPARADACDLGVTDKTWDGSTDNNWNVDANWTPAGVPTDADDVCVPSTPAATITYPATPLSGPEINSLELAESLQITGGTLTVAAASLSNSPELFWLDGGTFNGAGTLTVNGPSRWTAGIYSGSGQTVFNGNTTVSTIANKDLSQRTLTNNATITWTGGNLRVYDSGVFTNSATGVLDIQTDDDVFHCCSGSKGTFNNAGLVRKTITTGATDFDITFNNTATDPAKGVKVQTGQVSFQNGGTSTGRFEAEGAGDLLSFAGGTHNLDTTSNLFGAGEIRFSGGTTNFNAGTYNPTGLTNVTGGTANFNAAASTGTFTMSSGMQGGSNTLTVSGATTWSGGTFNGAGQTILNGATSITTAANKDVSQRTLTNNATVSWVDGGIRVYDSGVIVNSATGVLDVQSDADLTFCCSGSKGTFNNAGLVKKTAGFGATDIDMVFNNTATDTDKGVKVQTGQIAFFNGGTSTGRFEAEAGDILRFRRWNPQPQHDLDTVWSGRDPLLGEGPQTSTPVLTTPPV